MCVYPRWNVRKYRETKKWREAKCHNRSSSTALNHEKSVYCIGCCFRSPIYQNFLAFILLLALCFEHFNFIDIWPITRKDVFFFLLPTKKCPSRTRVSFILPDKCSFSAYCQCWKINVQSSKWTFVFKSFGCRQTKFVIEYIVTNSYR